MTPAQLRADLESLGLSRSEAAALFKVERRHVFRWLSGETSIPGAVELAMGLLTRRIKPAAVIKRVKVDEVSAA